MESALRTMEEAGIKIEPNDKKRLSPFGHEHINIVGHYSFDLAYDILKGKLRSLLPMDEKLFGI